MRIGFFFIFGVFGVAILAALPGPLGADETVIGLKIESAKDALNMISNDGFGMVSLKRLKYDIDHDVVYKFSRRYGDCLVEVESDNSPKHYGSVGFSFHRAKKPLDIEPQDIKKHFEAMGAAFHPYENTLTYSWKSEGFGCSVDFNKDMVLLEYLCHYSE